MDRSTVMDWMDETDRRNFRASAISLMDAYDDLEQIAGPYEDFEGDITRVDVGFQTYQRMSSDFTTIFNECDYLIHDLSKGKRKGYEKREKKFLSKDNEKLLRELRNLCAHRFGSSMDTTMLLGIAVDYVLPLRKSIRAMLLDLLKENPSSADLKERMVAFNRRPRRWFRRHRRSL